MDQAEDILELSENFKIDLDQVPYIDGRGREKQKKVARRRWAILAKALKSPAGSQPSSPTDEISVRRISSFMLLQTRELPAPPTAHPSDLITKRTWFVYSITLDPTTTFDVNVGHRNRTFSAEDLMGFNNTGNVCIWPSEETLSYYVCLNLTLFEGKRVLELGGGMSCLAGVFVAKYSAAARVLLTDGNKTSVENVSAILECNKFSCRTECEVLKWGQPDPARRQFDAILSADCLFFDDARVDFINCLSSRLAPGGFALVMAPRRGSTLDSFVSQSEARGLRCKRVMNYSEVVWEKRLALMSHCDYNDNIHYPVLIEVGL
ncbi:calmodulin-lysine N-methyltransferase isoform X2 [Anthonomus grandis grandis]|uniref:calmodulin-lysine N-methyltransferase isoform X2 n=1 Tax=Anthonomus grandis grandis TaxID=2921223 RepID=UPI002164F787|nr:calmodulin-lysine N-methyltransferase isoform X2 [Anthonomus grandis grandis]